MTARARDHDGRAEADSGYVACGAFACDAVIPDDPQARTDHLRAEHPDLYGTVYFSCPAPQGVAGTRAERT